MDTDSQKTALEEDLERNIARSGYREEGFAENYDRYRPHAPQVLVEILRGFTGVDRPRLVVDLGSGTGLSSLLWAEHADQVVGIEPNERMRAVARVRSPANVRFADAYSHATGLPGGSADVATCSQAIHWMEPETTSAEVLRILRAGGVFAAYAYVYQSPALHWELEQARSAVMARIEDIATVQQQDIPHRRWGREEHLECLRDGRFRFVKHIHFHSTELFTAERLVGMILSLGTVARVLSSGVTEQEVGLGRVRQLAEQHLGPGGKKVYLSYDCILAVK